MAYKPKYDDLMENPKIRRWFDNLKAKSILTATVYRRTLGYYCELEKTTPEKLLTDMTKLEFRDTFLDCSVVKNSNGTYPVR